MADGPLATFGLSAESALQQFVVPLTNDPRMGFLLNRALQEIQLVNGSVEKVLEVADHIDGQAPSSAIATLRWHAARMTLAQAKLPTTYDYATNAWVEYKKRPAWSPELDSNLAQWDHPFIENDRVLPEVAETPISEAELLEQVQTIYETITAPQPQQAEPIKEAIKLLRIAGDQLPDEYRAACYLDIMNGEASINPGSRLRFLTEVLESRSWSAYKGLTWQSSPRKPIDKLKLKRKIRHAFDAALQNDIGELLALEPKSLGSASEEWYRWFEDPIMGGADAMRLIGELQAVDVSRPHRYWLSQTFGVTKARLCLAIANYFYEKDERALHQVDEIVDRLPFDQPPDLEIGKLRVGARIAQRVKDIGKEFEYRRQLLFLEFANDPTQVPLGEALRLGELAAECADVELALRLRTRIGMPDRSDLVARAVAIESLAMQHSGDEIIDTGAIRGASLEKYETAAQIAQIEMDKVMNKISAFVTELRESCRTYFGRTGRVFERSLTAEVRAAYGNAGLYDPSREEFDSNDVARRIRPHLGPRERGYYFPKSANDLEKPEVYEAVVREALEPYRSLVDATTMAWIRVGLTRRSFGIADAEEAFQQAGAVAPYASDNVRRSLHFAQDYVPTPGGQTQSSGRAIGAVVRELGK